ncbi:MAG: hypothetical protein AUI16_04925 [Alphaproteobacteria bacterium 13_2_20CM_2_64_7]|nr:MAG: hypothetical protein AUI16_04925 [Alphaproteobacteria bacterium 13_2_20CM_2_64_7]
MTRNSTRPPGSTLTTAGSASVRSLARNASYFTSFRSGLSIAIPGAVAMPGAAVPIPGIAAGPGDAAPLMDGMPLFLSSAKICSGGVKLKSANMMMISCWSARSR